MSDILITLENITKTYTTEAESLTILSNISLSFEKGKKIAITGESGSGKSTLLNLIGGLDQMTSGSLTVGSYKLHEMTEEDFTLYRGRYIGFVFQFHYLMRDFTALENVMLPIYMQGLSKKKAEDKARALISDVGLENRITHYPSQLSGGERQRLAIARALIHDPELVLADEPTGNLDNSNSRHVQDMLINLVERYNKTLILVTHDSSFTERCDETWVLREGVLEQK